MSDKRTIVIAPSVRTTFRPTRRRRCFVGFEAKADDPALATDWWSCDPRDADFRTCDQIALHYLGQDCRVFLSPELPGLRARIPVREIIVTARLIA